MTFKVKLILCSAVCFSSFPFDVWTCPKFLSFPNLASKEGRKGQKGRPIFAPRKSFSESVSLKIVHAHARNRTRVRPAEKEGKGKGKCGAGLWKVLGVKDGLNELKLDVLNLF